MNASTLLIVGALGAAHREALDKAGVEYAHVEAEAALREMAATFTARVPDDALARFRSGGGGIPERLPEIPLEPTVGECRRPREDAERHALDALASLRDAPMGRLDPERPIREARPVRAEHDAIARAEAKRERRRARNRQRADLRSVGE